jgi:protein-tyrosine phosphatase
MHPGFAFACIGGMLLAAAVRIGGAAWFLIWPAISFAWIACGYFGLGPTVFGKQADGTLSAWRATLLFPFLALQYAIWHATHRIRRGPKFQELIPGLLIGRRLLSGDLPSSVSVVVDLTAEFQESEASRRVDTYWSFPVLDATAPDSDQLCHWVNMVSADRRTTYVHCAEGYGRTGLFAAAVLIERGIAAGPDDAIHQVQTARPGVRLNRVQRECLEQACRQMLAHKKGPASQSKPGL